MRVVKSRLVAAATLLALLFGFVPPASAAVTIPSGLGAKSPYILAIADVAFDGLTSVLNELGITPTHTYDDVFSGFSIELTQEQKNYIENLFPGLTIEADTPTSIRETQLDAAWDLSDLDAPGRSQDSNYKYPTSAGQGVRVYVLDTGISANAGEFGNRLLSGYDAIGGSGTSDRNGHGTHVAGTIASTTWGVAKLANVVPVRVLDAAGSGYNSDTIAGIDWVIGNKPNGSRAVINMSLGSDSVDPLLDAAIARAVAAGIFVAVAAGNDGQNNTDACDVSPSHEPSAFTVGSVGRSHALSYFSNIGTCVDILAQGEEIASLDRTDTSAGAYVIMQGTSMATPHVAGAAALYLSLHPSATVAATKTALLNGAETNGTNIRLGTPNKILDIAFMNSMPVVTTAPSVGTNTPAIIGQTVTATAGVWTSSGTYSVAKRWLACANKYVTAPTSLQNDCLPIGTESADTITVARAQVGQYLMVEETATGENGTVVAYSTTTEKVAEPASASTIRNTDAPTLGLATGSSYGSDDAPKIAGAASTTLKINNGIWSSDNGTPRYSYQWYRCSNQISTSASTLPIGCLALNGEVAQTYTVGSGDRGKYLLSSVLAENTDGQAIVYSKSSLAVTAAPTLLTPTDFNTSIEVRVGNKFDLIAATFDSQPVSALTLQWYSCTSSSLSSSASLPAGCSPIAGATSSSLLMTLALKGKYILAATTAKNSATSAAGITSYSRTLNTAVVSAPTLKLTATGTGGTVKFVSAANLTQNTKLAVDLTGWVTAPSYSYKWYRCESAGTATAAEPSGCELISGASLATYIVTAADVSKYLTAYVVAKNGASEVATASLATSPQVLQAPNNSVAPSVQGSAVVGETVTAGDGTWVATPSATYTYQWYSCSAAVIAAAVKNAKCAAIAGARSSTYEVPAAQNNKYLVVQVSATNSTNVGAPTSYYSSSSLKVLTAPRNTVAPTLSYSSAASTGQPVVGSTISVKPGTWTGNPLPTKTYRWFSCDAAVAVGTSAIPSGCEEIVGETETTLVTTSSMQTKYITALETANNTVSAPGIFAGVSLTLQPKPTFASDPAIQGTAKSGQTLSVNTGASSLGGTATPSYLWYRCVNEAAASETLPAQCTPQLSATGATFALTPNHEGGRYLVRVTLTNVAGSTVRFSATTNEVVGDVANITFAKPSSETSQPRVGSTLTVGANTWSGFPRSDPTFQWYRCDNPVAEKSAERPAGCSSIGGATGTTYTPTADDESKYLSVKAVNAQTLLVSATTWSPTTAQIYRVVSFGTVGGNQAEPRPTLGNQHIYLENNLTLDVGTTHGYPVPEKTYQWFRCDDRSLTESSTLPVGCTQVSGESGTTYEFKLRDVGKFILASVTLTNALGSEKVFTATTSVIGSLPVNTELSAPKLSGTGAVLKVGAVVESSQGTWTALPDATYSYSWYRCQNPSTTRQTSLPNACIDLGVTTETYELRKADSSLYIMYGVTAVNENGESTSYSPTTIDVGEPTSFTADPVLQNRFRKDEVIGSTLATAGWPAPQPSYRWFRCDAPVSAASSTAPLGCAVIPRATSADYTLTYADVSKYVVKEIRLTNRIDSSVRYTASSKLILLTPEITGNFTVTGQLWFDTAENPKVLTASPATIRAFPETVPVYQWYRGGTAIRNANGLTYTLTSADVGYQMSYTVSATNSSGSAISEPAFTADDIGQTPKLSTVSNAQKPHVCGTESDGEIDAGSNVWICAGDWIASPEISEYNYQWYICNSESPQGSTVPSTCTLIKNATEPELGVSYKDEGKYLGFTIKAKNGTEDRTIFAATSKKIYVKPEYRSGAAVTFGAGQAAKDGSPRVGYQIEASLGTWRGVATNTYTYQWFYCTGSPTAAADTLNGRCEEIIGAESRVLTVTDDLVGKFLGVKITGSYKYVALTDDPASSNRDIIYTGSTAKAVLAPPANVRLPYIASRYTYVHSTLKANDGEWTGSQPLSVTHTWWECTSPIFEATRTLPTGCVEIKNSTGNWKVTPAQVGKYLTSAAKASNMGGDVRIWSATQEVVKTGPVNVIAPVISLPTGATNPSSNTELRVSKGSWLGDPPPGDPSEYNWYRCDTAVRDASEFLDTNCQLIESARGNTYTPVNEDVRKYLLASVKASNSQGDWVAYTASTTQVYLPPSNVTVPSVPAEAFVGRNITGTHGTWDGYPDPTLSYQWYSCVARQENASATLPTGCEIIAKATADVYKPVVNLIDKFLILKVTAKNAAGEASRFSASTDSVVSGPVLVTAPTYTGSVEGHPVVGSSTSTDGGIWQGTPAPTKAYQWLVCDKDVTADDVAGQKDLPPVGVENPTSPTAFLTTKGCAEIEGATGDSITPNETFRGKFLMIHVTARNIHGVDDWYSAASKVVWMAPVIDTPVKVTGKTFNELFVHARLDTWKAFPEPTKTYSWFYCSGETPNAGSSAPSDCSAITTGASSADFKIPKKSDLTQNQKYLVVKVVAHNAAGTDGISYSATSTEIIEGPANTIVPIVTGNASYSEASPGALDASRGTWVPTTGDLTYRYQWYRCTKELNSTDELNETCLPIEGADTASYVVGPEDVLTPAEYAAFTAEQKLAIKGKTLLVGVTGSMTVNGKLESSTVFSKSTPFVTEKVNNVSAPTISGVPRIDTTINGLDGTWRGYPLPTETRKWYYCKTAKALKSLAKPADCSPIGNSNKTTMVVDDAFIGKYLVYSTTKTNKVGTVTTSVTVFSASTAQVAVTPILLSKPDLEPVGDFARSEAPKVGNSWKITSSWKKPTPGLSYKWYRCDERVDTNAALINEIPSGCSLIDGAGSISYEVRVADQGKYLLGQVIGTNISDAVTSFTNSSERPVAQPPLATTLPVISGSRNIGGVLSVTDGVWSPAGTEPRLYQWYSCSKPVPETVNEVPSFCDLQTGDTSSTYTVSNLDAGSYMTVKVSGTYQFSTTAYLLAVTEATELSPRIIYGGSKPSLDYETFLVGDLFTIKSGEWEGNPTPTLSYKWYRCLNPVDEAVQVLPDASQCVVIDGATNPAYNAVNADNGKYLVGAEIATNSREAVVWYTASSDVKVKAGYVQGSTAVSISVLGSAITTTSGITITSSPGTWTLGGIAKDAVLVHRWVYCKDPITTVLQKLPSGCNFMFDYKNSSSKLVADEDTAPLVLSIDTPFAGYYIASMEYVMSDAPIAENTIPIKERETFRVSTTSPLILMQPTLWTNPPTTELLSTTGGAGYQAPRIPISQYAVGDSGQSPLSVLFSAKFLKTTDPWADDVLPSTRITWRGVGDPNWHPNQQSTSTYAFATQWFRCVTEVPDLVFAKPADCTEIPGATSGTYTPTEDDVLKYITAKLTATNSVGSTSIWTKSTWHITQKVTAKVAPTLVTATTRFSGDVVTVNEGDWIGTEAPSEPTYKFYLCSTQTVSVASCGVSSTNSALPKQIPSTGRSATIPSLGGPNRTRYVVVEITSTNLPYLLNNTQVDPSPVKLRSTTVTLATERIYERPTWNLTTSVPLSTGPGTLVLTSATSGSNLNANVGQTLQMDINPNNWSATEAPTGYTYAWFECSQPQPNRNVGADTPSGCSAITGATSSSYLITRADHDKYILGRMTAENRFATGTSWTVTTPPISEAPYVVTPPTIALSGSGKPAVGDTIAGTSATFAASPSVSEDINSIQWFACNSAVPQAVTSLPAGCVAIPGAKNSNYTIGRTYSGKHLIYQTGASATINPNGIRAVSVAYSASVGDVEMDPEFGPTDPLITGTGVDSQGNAKPAVYHVGYTLKLANFNIVSNPTATSTWDWYVCSSPSNVQSLSAPPSDCVNQHRTDEREFLIEASMVGKYIAVFASAISRSNPTKKNSAFTKQITLSPLNTAAPTLAGNMFANGTNTVTATPGTWTASPADLSYSYAWYLCTSSVSTAGTTKPVGCSASPIAGEVSKTIVLKREWGGKYLVFEETAAQASNNTGLASTYQTKHYSASTAEIKTAPMFSNNTVLLGYKHVGEYLSASVSKSSGFETETETYQWYLCTSEVTPGTTQKPGYCDALTGETDDNYLLKADQKGKFVTVAVTLSNSVGSAVNFAATTSNAISKTPVATSAVTISGDDVVGSNKRITATTGTWDVFPAGTRSYKWYVCETAHSATGAVAGDDCTATAITSSTITLTSEYAGKYLQVAETATSSVAKPNSGTAVSFSATLGPIRMAPAFNTVPGISGVAHNGQTLSAVLPTTTAYPSASGSAQYSWYACATQIASSSSLAPNGCDLIQNSDNADLLLTNQQVGKSIMLVTTYTNSAGSNSKTSTGSALVSDAAYVTADPEVSGSRVYSSTALATVSKGTWAGTPAPSATSTYQYAWYLCTSAAVASNSLDSSCVTTSLGSASSLKLNPNMDGKYLVAKVSINVQTNQLGGTTSVRYTSGYGPIAVAATATSDPVISSYSPTVGATLTATSAGVWNSNTQPIDTSVYKWFSCPSTVPAGLSTTTGANAVSGSCTLITGFDGGPLQITSKLGGLRILLVVYASNGGGTAIRTSKLTATIPKVATTAAFRLY